MSVRVMSWVWEQSRAKPTQRLVLLAIADCANDIGTHAYPSMAKLVDKTRLSERAIQGAIAELSKLGELVVERNAGPGGCNRYRIVMTPAGDAPPQEMRGAGDAGGPPQEMHPTPAGDAGDPRRRCTPPPQEMHPEPSMNHPLTINEPSIEPSNDEGSLRSPSSPGRSKPKPDEPHRPDVDQVCRHLADRIAANGSKRPQITAEWRKQARLLLDNDGRTVDQIIRAIDWCQASDFWRANIMSMPKLRQRYDQLRLQAQRDAAAANGGHQPYRDPEDHAVYAAGL